MTKRYWSQAAIYSLLPANSPTDCFCYYACMIDHYLAQINIGRLIAPIDDPQIADFVAGLDPINALAERSPGFVWRLKSDAGNATDIAYNDDPFIIVNMSVWESLATLKNYVYDSRHLEFFKQRAPGSKEWISPTTASGGFPLATPLP